MRSLLLALMVGLMWLGGGCAAPYSEAIAAPLALRQNQPVEKVDLDLALLKSRLASPISKSGAIVIDLSNVTIDLRREVPESAALAEQFYQQVSQALISQADKQPTGLDLSGAIIKGELDLTQISLRVPAYGGISVPALDAFIANQPALASEQADIFVFQGPLWLNQTCFSGSFKAANLYLLNTVEAEQAIFTQAADWQLARFSRSANFKQAQFQQESTFRAALFAGRTRFNGADFGGPTDWQRATFHESASFAQARFHNANFTRSHWHTDADFDQAVFQGPITFQRSHFDRGALFPGAQFEAAVNLRQVQLQSRMSLRGALIRNQLDFGDARFGKGVRIGVADLDFNAGEAKILGSPGQLGRLFSVPSLVNNEAVLQNLVRNFRLLEQVGDANQVEYTTEQLRSRQLQHEIEGFKKDWISQGVSWIFLSGLLLLSDYGTNVTLVFSVGMIATTLFGGMFWLVDRYRRRVPTPIVPEQGEMVSMLIGSSASLLVGLGLLYQCQHPLLTLAALLLVTVPVPVAILVRLYQQGRYHDLMDVSYFVKNGALRKLQVLIARLPIIPQYPFYRDRYQPLLMNRRWSWLNYQDFSLNNWFKFGFNDIRLRDKAVPGLVSALVWYQWGLGISYIALLLWTLSRTIPGLNLLLYF